MDAMNDIFNGKRFFAYAVKHYTEHRRFYQLALLLLFLCILISNYFGARGSAGGSFLGFNPGSRSIISLVLMVLVAQTSFQDYRKRGRRIGAFMLPVSSLEKYLFGWFNSLVLFWAAYLLFNTITLYPALWAFDLPVQKYLPLFNAPMEGLGLLTICLLNAGVLFTNAFAKKDIRWAYVLTGGVILLWLLLPYLPAKLGWVNDAGYLQFPAFTELHPTLTEGEGYFWYTIAALGDGAYFRINEWFLWITTAFFWITGYFKFRERQLK